MESKILEELRYHNGIPADTQELLETLSDLSEVNKKTDLLLKTDYPYFKRYNQNKTVHFSYITDIILAYKLKYNKPTVNNRLVTNLLRPIAGNSLVPLADTYQLAPNLYELDKDVRFVELYPYMIDSHNSITLPHVMVNGASGLFPSHAIAEICEAIISVIDKPKISIKELCQHIAGPDLVFGGKLYAKDMTRLYRLGHAKYISKAKYEYVKTPKGYKMKITELPYGVNAIKLLNSIYAYMKRGAVNNINKVKVNGYSFSPKTSFYSWDKELYKYQTNIGVYSATEEALQALERYLIKEELLQTSAEFDYRVLGENGKANIKTLIHQYLAYRRAKGASDIKIREELSLLQRTYAAPRRTTLIAD